MLLLLFRHGEAEEPGPGRPDSKRRLTPQGQTENRRCLEAVLRAGARPDAIVHSPLVRAVQTAQAAAELLDPPAGLCEDEGLACGAQLRDVEEIARQHSVDTLMLVGHNPDFSVIAGELIGSAAVPLKTSGIAAIRLPVVSAGAGELQWLIKPKLFA
jgi:phosphohistidine phosphatase